MNRISLKRLAQLGGRIPRSTILPNTDKKPPVRQVSDPRNERGYRELVNAAELHRRLIIKGNYIHDYFDLIFGIAFSPALTAHACFRFWFRFV